MLCNYTYTWNFQCPLELVYLVDFTWSPPLCTPDIFTCALVSYEYLCGFNNYSLCINTLILLSCNITVVLQKSIHGWSWLASATYVQRCQSSLWSMHWTWFLLLKNSPYYILVRTPGNDESICWILLITWLTMSKMGAENTTMLCFLPFQLITASINFKNYQMPSHPHTEDRAKWGVGSVLQALFCKTTVYTILASVIPYIHL